MIVTGDWLCVMVQLVQAGGGEGGGRGEWGSWFVHGGLGRSMGVGVGGRVRGLGAGRSMGLGGGGLYSEPGNLLQPTHGL